MYEDKSKKNHQLKDSLINIELQENDEQQKKTLKVNNSTRPKQSSKQSHTTDDDIAQNKLQTRSKTNTVHSFQLTVKNPTSFNIKVEKIKYVKLRDLIIKINQNSQYIDIKNHQKELQTNIYYFRVNLNSQEWIIRKTYSDLAHFSSQIKKKFSMNRDKIRQIPDLPYEKEPQDNSLDPQIVLNFLEVYMIAVSKQEFLWKEDAYWEFLELSDFNHEGIIKVKEAWVDKRAGGRFEYQNCCRNLLSMINNWNKRYMVITQDGVMYSKGNRNPIKIREMLLFDSNFKMETGQLSTGKEFGIKLITSSRILVIKAFNFFQFVDIIMSFLEALEISPYTKVNRFNSFAPIRQNAICKWYVDGSDYYQDVYDKLTAAKSQVYITDWWLSPELYLKRPVGPKQNQESRLDRVLQSLAQKGVKIFILVYRESKIALTLDSEYTKQALQYNMKNHDNIIVLRHPNSVLPFLWSHHEKMVIIDQMVGFMGGLDLCYGRYDTQDHSLEDLPQKNQEDDNYDTINFPGIDYSNARIADFVNVKNHQKSQIDRNSQPRMPWHDIHLQVTGDPVKDMTRHFIQYWNFAKNNIYDKENDFGQIVPSIKDKDDYEKGMFKKGIVKFKMFKEKLKNKMKQNKEEKQNDSEQDVQSQKKVIGFGVNKYNTSQNQDQGGIELNEQKKIALNNNDQNKQQDQESYSSFQNYIDQVKQEQLVQNENSILQEENDDEQSSSDHDQQNIDTTMENNLTTSDLNPKQNKYQEQIDGENTNQINKFISQSEISTNTRKLEKKQTFKDQYRKSYLDQDIYRPKRQSVCFYNTPQKYEEESQESEDIHIKVQNEEQNKKNDQSNENDSEDNNNDGIKENLQNSNKKIDINESINEQEEDSQEENDQQEQQNGQDQDEDQDQDEQFQQVKTQIENIIFKKDKVSKDSGGNKLKSNEKLKEIFEKNAKKNNLAKKNKDKIFSHQNSVQISDINSRSKFANSTNFTGNQFKFQIKKQKSLDDVQIYQDQNQLALPILEEIARECKEQELINFYQKDDSESNTQQKQINDKNLKKNQYKNEEQEEHEMQQQLQEEEEQRRIRKQPDIQFLNNIQDKMGTCTCQMLRSASQWSLGLQPGHKEMSIQVAYIELITKAQHFIYIENQFFISNSAGSMVKNKIAQAIIDRIKLAAERKEKFKVVVIMPLLPGFEGEINGSNSTIMKCQLYWEYCTISRGGNSILEQLERDKNIQDPSQYIEFYGLRNHGKLSGKPVTEIVYVHSKLMIIDDNYVIIGSANINDRSQQGSRDSEVCMVIEDQYKVSGKLAEKNVQVGEFSTTLRRQLYQEHFGLNEKDSIDPLNQNLLTRIKDQTKLNTEIYREVFACYPDDNYLTISQYEQSKLKQNLEKYDESKDKIIGHAVQFPLYFLQRENLNLKYTNKEYFVPAESFT